MKKIKRVGLFFVVFFIFPITSWKNTFVGIVDSNTKLFAEKRNSFENSDDWEWIQNGAEGYRLFCPENASIRRFSNQGVLHVSIPNYGATLIVKVHNISTEKLSQDNLQANIVEAVINDLQIPIKIDNYSEINVVNDHISIEWEGPFENHRLVVIPYENQTVSITYPLDNTESTQVFERIVDSWKKTQSDQEDIGVKIIETNTAVINALALTVPHYFQNDSDWKCDQLGSCNQECTVNQWTCNTNDNIITIGDSGCAITSYAMIFEYYTNEHFMNPLELDTCFTKNNEYTNHWKGCGKCARQWGNLNSSTCKPTNVSYVGTTTNHSVVESDLNKGYPLIGELPGHYVVITGKNGSKYQVNDPVIGYPSERDIGVFTNFIRFSGTVPSSDTTPPATRVTSGPSGWIRTDSATIEWTGSDDQTSKANLVYSYKLDGASWSSWTGNTSKTYNNLAEGSHTFWVKAKDEAGNVDASPAERSFKVDTTKPNTPTINPGCTASDNQWQNTCRDPSFSWSATDPNGSDGSGVDEYAYAWNTSANGNPSNWGSVTSHNPGPIVDSDGVGQYYLHVKAKDVAGNTSSVNSFGLWYDGSAPTTALAINGGASTTNQVTVHLNIEPSDTGGGVSQVRISNNGIHWTPWQPYAETISWAIPALDLHTHTVYVQVRDKAGNTSPIVSDDIYLDLYPIMPHSENYRLCANVIDIGGSVDAESTSFKLTSAIGQPLSTGTSDLTSTNFAGRSGFLSSTTGCLPIEHTVTDDFTLTNWVIASGGNLHSSATYQLQETIGQPVASGATTMSSASFQLSSGFWGSTNRFAGDCVLLNFDPQSGSLPLHQTLTVDILASNVVDLYGAQLEISFDPTKLQVVDDDAGLAGVQISPGTCPTPDNVVQNTVDSTAGTISYSAHSLSPSPPCNEGGTVASITFEGVGGGNSSLGFYTTLVSDTTGVSICAHTTDGRLEIVTSGACIFTGTIELQSRSDDSGASFTAGAYATTTDASGYYELTVPEDTYDVTAEMDLYLDGERTGEVCLAGEEIQLPSVTLLGGDTNDDCVINILDLSFMGSRFMTSAGDANYDPRADINDDGEINILDLSVTGGNFMGTCPVNWPWP